MSRIAIVTDTDASLPADLAARYNIRQVSITVHFGNEVLRANVDINDTQLFARIDREGKLPTTAAPSPGNFAEAFQAAFDGGAETVLCFCVSAVVSATHGSAVVARDMFPDRDISIIDTQSVTMGQGFMVLAAAQGAEQGASKEDCMARAMHVRERTHLYASLATLKYLAMSGRVGYLTAGMAGLLDVKPIVTIRNAKLDMLERVRSRKKAWARVIELLAQAAGTQSIEQMAIVHVNMTEPAKEFEAQLRASLKCPPQIIYTDLNPGMSVHSGAGMLGAVIVTG